MGSRKLPNFYFENKLWKQGYKFVAGMDEVGRGCFAGPVVAAACAFAPTDNLKLKTENSKIEINDSKKLTARQREISEKWIKENAVTWGIGQASVCEINKLGIAKAANSAFRRAVANANQRYFCRVDYLLIDAFFVPYLVGFPSIRKVMKNGKVQKINHKNTRQLAITKGDCKSLSIAAASIIAKVYRDGLMEKIGARMPYRRYDWIKNKGYGTKVHREAILKYGICRHHRKKFVKTYLSRVSK